MSVRDDRAALLALLDKLGIEAPALLRPEVMLEVAAREIKQRGWHIPKEPERGCGTRAKYGRGCRCDACVEANRRYHQNQSVEPWIPVEFHRGRRVPRSRTLP